MITLVLMLIVAGGAAGETEAGWRRQEFRLPGDVWAVIPADENGDGRIDLVVTHGSSAGPQISVFLQGESGFPTTPQETWSAPHGAMAVIVDDIVAGGGAEVATIQSKGIVLHRRRQDEAGRVYASWKLIDSFFDFGVQERLERWDLTVDLDGDSIREVIVPSRDGYRIIDGSDPNRERSTRLLVPAWTELDPAGRSRMMGRLFTSRSSLPRLVLRGLNGDSLKDLAFLHGGALMGFIRGEDGSFASRPDLVQELLPVQKLGAGAIGQVVSQLTDLTRDGLADLVVSRVIGEIGFFETLRTHVAIFHATGPGRFRETPDQVILVKGVSIEPKLLDFDRDGDLDLFVSALRTDMFTNIKNVIVRWVTITYHGYLNQGDGTFSRAPSFSRDVDIPVGLIEQGKTVPLAWFNGDFDGDGMGDVLSVEGPERTVAYPGRRDGDRIGFGEDPIFSIAGAASDGVEIADLTGDGRSDVIMRFSRGDEKNRFVLILSPRGGKAR
ncbi:MAG: VCBS repeat-containing protein [Planctomycetota bacterium]|nr:VCBS repeat-containing protein [Planctomycetota bacterium]